MVAGPGVNPARSGQGQLRDRKLSELAAGERFIRASAELRLDHEAPAGVAAGAACGHASSRWSCAAAHRAGAQGRTARGTASVPGRLAGRRAAVGRWLRAPRPSRLSGPGFPCTDPCGSTPDERFADQADSATSSTGSISPRRRRFSTMASASASGWIRVSKVSR